MDNEETSPEQGIISPSMSLVIKRLRLPMMIMVVFIHCKLAGMQRGELSDCIQILFSEVLSSVAVPLFMFIAGFLFFAKLRRISRGFWIKQFKKRFKSLVIPYILWNIIVIGMFFSIHTFAPHIINPEFENIQQFSFLRLLNCFWGGWLVTLMYFSLGIYVAIHKIDFTRITQKYRFLLLVVAIILMIVWVHGPATRPLRIGYVLCASLYIVSGKFWLYNNAINRFLDKYSAAAFFIFAFHTIIAMATCRVIEIIDAKIIVTYILWILLYFLNISVNIAICIGGYNLLHRYCPKLLSILTGGR